MKEYKSTRKYKCPYCSKLFTRNDLVDHIDRKHEELIPEDFSAARVSYEAVNKKDHGTCMICKSDTHEWDEKLWKYKNLCNNPNCKKEVSNTADKRMLKVYNTTTLLYDPAHQEKMLAKRKISGTYKFQDGNSVTYTGKYEKAALEFFDTVLNVESKDILCPGPTLEYIYEGNKHFWITDMLYIPANLIIEIKDGGNNPNRRPMQSYREKQVAKEVMITDLGEFNYIRLTNNDFSQLLLILAELKQDMMDDSNTSKPGVRINVNEITEYMGVAGGPGGMPPNNVATSYIIPYGHRRAAMNDDSEGYAFTNDMDDFFIVDDDSKLKKVNESFFKDRLISLYAVNMNENNISKLKDAIHNDTLSKNFFLNTIAEINIGIEYDINFDKNFRKIDLESAKIDTLMEQVKNGIWGMKV